MYCLQACFSFTKSLCLLWVISEGMFHRTFDFWRLTCAGNWEQLSCFSAYLGSSAQQKSQGIWWPQHKAASCSAYLEPTQCDCMPGPAAGKALHTTAQLHSRSAPGKLSTGTEAAASRTAFPKGQKSWTSALTQHYLQTQFYYLLCLQLLNQALAHYLIGPLILIIQEFKSFVKTFVKNTKLNTAAI